MTLNELTQKLNGSIHIGASGGSGFIYCGPVDQLDLMQLDNRILRNLIIDTRNVKRTERYVKQVVRNYVPLGLRDIVDMYPSISQEDTTIVIVNGKEKGSQMKVEPPPIKFHGCIDNLAVERLVAGCYKQVIEELILAYKKGQCLKRQVDDISYEQSRLECWLMREKDPDINGFISNPEWVIHKIKSDYDTTKQQKHHDSFARCFASEDKT